MYVGYKKSIKMRVDITKSWYTTESSGNLGEEPTQAFHDNTLIAEAKYRFNFTQSRKKFVLTLL